jgi:uncharacterized cupin superfamily protein
MAYTVVDEKDVEARRGVFRLMRKALGATAFGINRVDLPAGAEGIEHDESGSHQEEVYVILGGRGTMRIDDGEVELVPGRWLRVGPESTRQMVAGADGLSWIVVGGVPGAAYVAEGPF